MEINMKTLILILVTVTLTGCTQAEMRNMTTIGTPGVIKCYSGGKLIYEGASTGKIGTEQGSDGWQFVDAKTNKFVRVSGDCVIEN